MCIIKWRIILALSGVLITGQCSEENFEKNNYFKLNEKIKEKCQFPAIENSNERKRNVDSADTTLGRCPISETSKITPRIAHRNFNYFINRNIIDRTPLFDDSLGNIRKVVKNDPLPSYKKTDEFDSLNYMYQSLMDNIFSYLSLTKNKREAPDENGDETPDTNFDDILNGAGLFLNNLIHNLDGNKFKTHGSPGFHNSWMNEDLKDMNSGRKYADSIKYFEEIDKNKESNPPNYIHNFGIINTNDIDRTNSDLFKMPAQETGSVDRKYADLLYGMNLKSRLNGFSKTQDIGLKTLGCPTSKTMIYSDFHQEKDSDPLSFENSESILNNLEPIRLRENNNEEFIRKIVDEEICKVLKVFRDSLCSTLLSNSSISSNFDHEYNEEINSIPLDDDKNVIPSEGTNDNPSKTENRGDHFLKFENDTYEREGYFKVNEPIINERYINDPLKNKEKNPNNDTTTSLSKDNVDEENSIIFEDEGDEEEAEVLKYEPSPSTPSVSKSTNSSISNKKDKNSIFPDGYSDYFWKMFKSEYMLKNEINNKGRAQINTQPKHRSKYGNKILTPPSAKRYLEVHPDKDHYYFTITKPSLIDHHIKLENHNHGDLTFPKYNPEKSTPNIDSDKNNIPFQDFIKFGFRNKSLKMKPSDNSEDKRNGLIVNKFRNCHSESFSQINKNPFQENNLNNLFEHTSLKINFLETPIQNATREKNLAAEGYNEDFKNYTSRFNRNRICSGNLSEINKNPYPGYIQNKYLEPTSPKLKSYDSTKEMGMATQGIFNDSQENIPKSPPRFKSNIVQIENLSRESKMQLLKHRSRHFFKDTSPKTNIPETSQENIINENNLEVQGDSEGASLDISTQNKQNNEPMENTSELSQNIIQEYNNQNIFEETSKSNDLPFAMVTNEKEIETPNINKDNEEYFQDSIPRFITKDNKMGKGSEMEKNDHSQSMKSLFEYITPKSTLEENYTYNENSQNNYEASSPENPLVIDQNKDTSRETLNSVYHNLQKSSKVNKNNSQEGNVTEKNTLSKQQSDLDKSMNQAAEFRISSPKIESNISEEQLVSFQINYPSEESEEKFKITNAPIEKYMAAKNASAENEFVTLIVPISEFKEMLKKQIYNKTRRFRMTTMLPSKIRKKYFYFKKKHPPNTKVTVEQITLANENKRKMRKLGSISYKYNKKMINVHESGKMCDPGNVHNPGNMHYTIKVHDPCKTHDPGNMRDPSKVLDVANIHDLCHDNVPVSNVESGNANTCNKNSQEFLTGNSTVKCQNVQSHRVTFKKSPDSNEFVHGRKPKYIKVLKKTSFPVNENHPILRKLRNHKARSRYQNTNQAGFEIENETSNFRLQNQAVNFNYDKFGNYEQYPHMYYRKKKYNEQDYYD